MMEKSSYTANNRGFQDEPPDQDIPSRSIHRNSNDEFHGIDQHLDGHMYIPMQPMGQFPQAQQGHIVPGIARDQYGYPVPVQVHYGHPVGAMHQPTNQYMVRDPSTPMPNDGHDAPVRPPSIGGIIFKRIVSSIFIVLDISLNWLQYRSWVGDVKLPDWLDFLETANSLKGNSPFRAQCSEGSFDFTSTFVAFAAIGTIYGCVRVVNMVGETILEYQKQNPSETEPQCRGFQILHGWVETLLAILCDDLPQLILLVVFSIQCSIDYTAMGKVVVWTIFKMVKNNFRAATCKQVYKPCCECKPCCDDVCVYDCDFICCCTKIYFRPCGCCCNKECCESETYELCPDGLCMRAGSCFGEIKTDPKWALEIFENIQSLYTLLLCVIVVMALLKELASGFVANSLGL